jgi:hypothetical protein
MPASSIAINLPAVRVTCDLQMTDGVCNDVEEHRLGPRTWAQAKPGLIIKLPTQPAACVPSPSLLQTKHAQPQNTPRYGAMNTNTSNISQPFPDWITAIVSVGSMAVIAVIVIVK